MGVALDPASGELTMAGAGHPPLLVVRPGGVEARRSQCPPLGLQANLTAEEESLTLAPGEGFLLFTDGFYDVVNAEGVRMEMSTLESDVSAAFGQPDAPPADGESGADGFLRTLLGRLHRYGGSDSFSDDLAAVAAFRAAGTN